MKIVLATRVYPTQRPGGLPHVCQDRAEALAAAGHDVTVLTTGLPGYTHKEVKENGVRILHLNCPPMDYTAAFALQCKAAVAKIRPELVHLESCDRDRPWWDDRPRAYRTAITMHGFELGGYLTKLNLALHYGDRLPNPEHDKITRERKVLRDMFDRVIAMCHYEYRLLASHYNVAESRLRLVYNPIAPYFFTPPVPLPAADKPRFLCAAVSGHSERGFALAKEAADSLGYELVIAKAIARRDMPDFIDGFHGLVIPTFYAQGFDLTFAEARARQRPIICTTAGSYFDESQALGAEDESCIRVSMGNVTQLAAAMQRVMTTRGGDSAYNVHRHRPNVHVTEWLTACME